MNRALFYQNVVDAQSFGILVTSMAAPLAVVFDSNSLVTRSNYPVMQFQKGVEGEEKSEVTFTRNIVISQPDSWASSQFGKHARMAFNIAPMHWTHFEKNLMIAVPLQFVGTPAFSNYLRLQPDTIVSRRLKSLEMDRPPGALPFEPHATEDWFDRLRNRWQTQIQINESLATQLQNVPRF